MKKKTTRRLEKKKNVIESMMGKFLSVYDLFYIKSYPDSVRKWISSKSF